MKSIGLMNRQQLEWSSGDVSPVIEHCLRRIAIPISVGYEANDGELSI
jgi:hypothetical protein